MIRYVAHETESRRYNRVGGSDDFAEALQHARGYWQKTGHSVVVCDRAAPCFSARGPIVATIEGDPAYIDPEITDLRNTPIDS
jgi:hypothetical protein|tara:strand:+ start:409 stop:657 length:249 start_codon:yes stop_codon:yes gene_type:complete